MVAITYRTPGAWGAGIGVNLSAAQVDANNYAFDTAIEDLIANPPEPNSITSITASGLSYVFHFSDTTTITLPIPFVSQKFRGEWLPTTFYATLDTVTVAGVGGFVALLDHTSPAEFDPDQTIAAEAVWLKTFSDPANAITSAIYDLPIIYQGRLSDMTLPIAIPAMHAIMIPAAGTHSARLGVAPSTANQVLPLLHGATQIGTVTFLIGSQIGTVVITADETFAVDEYFSIGLPLASDATAAGMSLGIKAQRVLA